MAKSKNKPTYNEIEFDSNEEIEFYHWIQEAMEYGFIKDFSYNVKSYDLSPKVSVNIEKQLKTKTKIVSKHLLNAHIYTPDFIFEVGEKFPLLEDKHGLYSPDGTFVIDVKGSFQLHDGSRSFSMNQKWMYDKYGIYVNKVIPKKFFSKTWVPEKCRFTEKTRKERACYKGIPTLIDKFGL